MLAQRLTKYVVRVRGVGRPSLLHTLVIPCARAASRRGRGKLQLRSNSHVTSRAISAGSDARQHHSMSASGRCQGAKTICDPDPVGTLLCIHRRRFIMAIFVNVYMKRKMLQERNRISVGRMNAVGAEMLCAEWALGLALSMPPTLIDEYRRGDDPGEPELVFPGRVKFHGIAKVYRDAQFLPRPQGFVFCRPLVVEMLDCSHLDVTDIGLRHVVFLSRLRELHLCHCKHVTNVGMRHVATVGRTLRQLSLRGCWRLTSESIPHLSRLQQLDILDVRETKLAEDGEHLRRALPKCQLIL